MQRETADLTNWTVDLDYSNQNFGYAMMPSLIKVGTDKLVVLAGKASDGKYHMFVFDGSWTDYNLNLNVPAEDNCIYGYYDTFLSKIVFWIDRRGAATHSLYRVNINGTGLTLIAENRGGSPPDSIHSSYYSYLTLNGYTYITKMGTTGFVFRVNPALPPWEVHHGTKSMRVATSSYGGVHKAFSALGIAYARAYIKFLNLPPAGQYADLIALISTEDWIYSAGARIRNVNGNVYWGIYCWEGGTPYQVLESSPSNPSTDVWYCVEIMRDVVNDVARIWVNGELKATYTGTITYNNSGLDCGVGYTTFPVTAYFDCAVVADTYIGKEEMKFMLTVLSSPIEGVPFTIREVS